MVKAINSTVCFVVSCEFAGAYPPVSHVEKQTTVERDSRPYRTRVALTHPPTNISKQLSDAAVQWSAGN